MTTRIAVLALLLLAAGGCAMFSPAARAQARRAAAEQEALKGRAARILNDFARSLKGKVWDSVEPSLHPDDPQTLRELKARTEALWKRGQLLDLTLVVVGIERDKDLYVAAVRWEQTLLERGQLLRSDGKCAVIFKKSEDRLLILSVSKDDSFL